MIAYIGTACIEDELTPERDLVIAEACRASFSNDPVSAVTAYKEVRQVTWSIRAERVILEREP